MYKPIYYIAGPISGKEGRNEKEFRRVASIVEMALNVTPTIPHDIHPAYHAGDPCPDGVRSEGADHNEPCYLRSDLLFMLNRCQGIVLMHGWNTSHGARLEHTVATACGLPVYVMMGDDTIMRLY